MAKKIAISCLLVLCVVLTCACELVKSPDYYELNDNDTVISFTKVVGDRKVSTTKIEMKKKNKEVMSDFFCCTSLSLVKLSCLIK